MGNRYSLTEEQKTRFACIYVLEYMINQPRNFDVLLSEEDSDLEPILTQLIVKEYVKIHDKQKYIPTPKGREALERFVARYTDYMNVYDVYCAVDLGEGTFAFASYFDFESDIAWGNYLEDERWEDLRIAVAEFKKLDPVEIVFMSFINEGRFGKDGVGWQFDLLLGTVWDEILEICETALHVEDLGYEDEEGVVSGEAVLKDVIEQGAHLVGELHEHEAKLDAARKHEEAERRRNEDDGDDEEFVEKVVVEEYLASYYRSYYDPYYVAPCWGYYWW